MFSIADGSFKSFDNYTVKLSAKETNWTLSEVRKCPTFLKNLISKYDFGPVKLSGLSRNWPLYHNIYLHNARLFVASLFFLKHVIEAKSEHEQKARGVAGGEAREASQTKNIYLGPHFAGSSLSFNAGVQFSRDSTVRSTIE